MSKFDIHNNHKKYPPGDIRRLTDIADELRKKQPIKEKIIDWLDDKIFYCYHGKTRLKFIPFYFELFGYRLCIYAMNMDWESTRIKIENVKDSYRIVKVIKKGKY